MVHVSREGGRPRKCSDAIDQPATTTSTCTKRPLASTSAMSALRRDGAAETTPVRGEETSKCWDLMCSLERDHEDALQCPRDCVATALSSEMLRVLKAKDVEVHRKPAVAREGEELLKLQFRDVAARTGTDVIGFLHSGATSGVMQKLQQEATALRSQDKQIQERLQVTGPAVHGDGLQALRRELKEKDRIIAELQLAARFQDKDGRSDQLTERNRMEQMGHYYRNFLELEPVAEMEEDSGAGEYSPPSSRSPSLSLSPQIYTADMWTELPDTQHHDTLYSCLLKEHLELESEYQFLQNRLKSALGEPNRTRLKLEHELTAAMARIRKLKKLLDEQEGNAAVLTERLTELQAETDDLREQNELLEFRILELEECHDKPSAKGQGPDTRDVWTDTESDDFSESGVQSPPSNDSDTGIGDMKTDVLDGELKSRLQDLVNATLNTAERSCLQQVLELLDRWKCCVQQQDTATVVRTPRNPSECNRIIATVLPFTDRTPHTDGRGEGEIKRHLKNAENLQESGIFEETECSSQGTQTGDLDYEHPLGGAGLGGGLSAEIERLNQFRERVEEAGQCCGSKKLIGVVDDLPAHRKELEYCRERLQLLEGKVRLYESSGDEQTRLIAERVQREVGLSAQVKELSAKVQQLVTRNRGLEEEKCELEETENDTRLRCQKLELKLATLSESKADVESELLQERRTLGWLRGTLARNERREEDSRRHCSYLEVMLNKYEQRNYELEEREVDLRHRLEMLECCVPALVIWHVWRVARTVCRWCVTADRWAVAVCPPCTFGVQSSGFQDVEQGRPRIKAGLAGSGEVGQPAEEELRLRCEDLEAQVVRLDARVRICEENEGEYKRRIAELEGELYGSKNEAEPMCDTELGQNQMSAVRPAGCTSLECMTKVQELAESGADMKKLIVELERKERAYMETLHRADELWSDMETAYKRQISDAEDNEAAMLETVRKLQESEAKLREAFGQDDESEMLLERIHSMEESEKAFTERIRALETERNQYAEEMNRLRDEQKELEETKEMVAGPLQEELSRERRLSKSLKDEVESLVREGESRAREQQVQMNGLKVQLCNMSRDLVDLECTNGELKEEVETLEAKISDLKAIIEEQKQCEEQLVIEMSQKILQKEEEMEELKRELRYSVTPNARDELREVESCDVSRETAGRDAALQPAGLDLLNDQPIKDERDPPKSPATPVPISGHSKEQVQGTTKEMVQQLSEGALTRQQGCRCSGGVEQSPPVTTLSQKPVLRRWLLSQSLQPKECGHWRN